MRVAYALQGLVAASAATAISYNPQHVVLGIDGMVVVDADPSLYFRPSKTQLDHNLPETEQEPSDLVELDSELPGIESDELPLVELPSVHNELLVMDDFDLNAQANEGDEFISNTELEVPSVPKSTFDVIEDIGIPGVCGSIIFAELSCCFVAFIGYLVHSIPLWLGFSRGQKCCLIVAFSMAFLYQIAVLGWFVGTVSQELILGLSSLITRMISLGMVPITTTSFMGRAREICQDHAAMAPSVCRPRKASHSSRNSRRHHGRARSS